MKNLKLTNIEKLLVKKRNQSNIHVRKNLRSIIELQLYWHFSGKNYLILKKLISVDLEVPIL